MWRSMPACRDGRDADTMFVEAPSAPSAAQWGTTERVVAARAHTREIPLTFTKHELPHKTWIHMTFCASLRASFATKSAPGRHPRRNLHRLRRRLPGARRRRRFDRIEGVYLVSPFLGARRLRFAQSGNGGSLSGHRLRAAAQRQRRTSHVERATKGNFVRKTIPDRPAPANPFAEGARPSNCASSSASWSSQNTSLASSPPRCLLCAPRRHRRLWRFEALDLFVARVDPPTLKQSCRRPPGKSMPSPSAPAERSSGRRRRRRRSLQSRRIVTTSICTSVFVDVFTGRRCVSTSSEKPRTHRPTCPPSTVRRAKTCSNGPPSASARTMTSTKRAQCSLESPSRRTHTRLTASFGYRRPALIPAFSSTS